MPYKNRKIHVLFAMGSLGVGGAEQLIYTLARSLPRDRFQVVVCTLFSRGEKPEPLADEIRSLGIRVDQLAMTRWRDFATMRQFLAIIDEEHIDIVHGHMVPADFWSCMLAKVGRRCKTLHTKHDLLPRSGRAMKIQRVLLERFLSDRIVAISDVVADHLVRDRGISARQVVKIPNPVDVERFHPDVSGHTVREALGIPAEAVVIGNTSRFEKRKGYRLFLDIAKLVVARHENVRFLAVGHGSERGDMEKQVREAGLEEQIIITGPRRDIPEVIAAMDIFLFTSLWGEGFGIVLIEAMAAGKAVVSANVGPAGELLEDGTSGCLPAPETWVAETQYVNPEPFADQIEPLITRPDERQKFGEAARRRAIELYSTEAVACQTEKVYRDILGWH